MVIYLLSSSPKNGVELMNGVESITRGWWRPTPGSVYPLLKEMTDQGIVNKLEDGRYELTQKGRSQALGTYRRSRRRSLGTGEILDRMSRYAAFLEEARGTPEDELPAYMDKVRELYEALGRLLGKEKDRRAGP